MTAHSMTTATHPLMRVVLSPLDVLRASQLAGAEHHITTITAVGAACDRCNRLLDVLAWAAPCPGRAGDTP